MNSRNIIKKSINEVLGVPDNIYETSLQIYEKLLRASKKLDKDDFENYGARLNFRGQFNISDFPFTGIKFQLGIEENKLAKEPEIVSMVIRSESKKEDLKLIPINSKTLDLLMIFVVPIGFDYSTLPDVLIENKDTIVENLTHELKHAYDHFKKPSDSAIERSSYQSIVGKSIGVPSADKFIYYMYYISAIENLVRPSEIYAAIRNKKITQKDFLNFLRDNETYKILKEISEFSLEKLKQDLKGDIKYINKVLKKGGFDVDNMSDIVKINTILRIIWINVTNWKNEGLKDVLTTSFFEEMLGFEGEKDKLFKKIVNRNLRFNRFSDFFRFYEKDFNHVSNDMIKKIAKLYAITQK